MPSKAALREKRESGLFDVEVAFTGLGVVLLDSGGERHNPNPGSVEFLLLRVPIPDTQGEDSENDLVGEDHQEHHSGHDHGGNAGGHFHAEPHLPRLWLRLDDLAGPQNLQFNNMTAGTDGLPTVGLDLSGKDFSISVVVDEPGIAAEESAFDVRWASNRRESVSPKAIDRDIGIYLDHDLDLIPDIEEHFGLDSIVLPDPERLPAIYAARVRLPPGRIMTRRPLLNPDTSPAQWVFVDQDENAQTLPQTLTDQVIWSRRNVKSLHIDLEVEEGLTFDASVRESHGERPLVALAITNLPGTALSGRFGSPEHFALLQQVAGSQNRTIRQIRRTPALPGGDPITTGGACPPARKEI